MYPRKAGALALQINQPDLPNYIRRFLYSQRNPDDPFPALDQDISLSTIFDDKISVFHSAFATYYAPSDPSGVHGMLKQCIRSTPNWRQGPPRRDCVFIKKDAGLDGMRGLHVAQVLLFLSFTSRRVLYPCALVQWFVVVGDAPCGDTGMWIVRPEMVDDDTQVTSIIHTNTIVRGAHLIGVYGEMFLPRDFSHFDSLVAFQAYYVNKFIDYHANEISF